MGGAGRTLPTVTTPEPVQTLQELLRLRADSDRPAVITADRELSWRAYVEEASRWASALLSTADDARRVHVGVMLGNTADMLVAMAAAALGGFVLCGINTTRRGSALARDITLADVTILLVNAENRGLLDGLDLPGVSVIDVDDPETGWRETCIGAPPLTPRCEVSPTDTFMLIFTSGTSGDPKAVRVAHMMPLMGAQVIAGKLGVTADDVCYLSMPLFHSNAVAAGWAVAAVAGAAMVPAAFSASRFIDDLRRFGITYMNYVGKPLAYILATERRPDDADNSLRVAFGNEASDRDIAEFAERFGVFVLDAFGSTENAIVVRREPGTPPGSIGLGLPGVAVYHAETMTECAPAVFDSHGALSNPEDAIGELVNTHGAGVFAGYYNDDAATAERMHDGMYWSGDLAYRDTDGWIYLAGRTADWMRIDGENIAAGPVERVLMRHPAVSRVAVYAVPDRRVGDAMVAALVPRDPGGLDPAGFAEFLAGQEDLSTKAWPKWVRVESDLPTTATNKILKRELAADGLRSASQLWERADRGRSYTRRADGAVSSGPVPAPG